MGIIEVGGLLGILMLVAVIWAILSIMQSRAGMLSKVLWIVLIIILPLLGFILWLLLGPKADR